MKKTKFKTLAEFIEEMGDIKAAELFGVAERGASTWRRYERIPKPSMAAHIIKVAGGVLTWESIYGHLISGDS